MKDKSVISIILTIIILIIIFVFIINLGVNAVENGQRNNAFYQEHYYNVNR